MVKKLKRPDLLYITSTPLTTGLIGLWAKGKLAILRIFEVRNLWPKAFIEVGAIGNPLLIKYLQHLEARTYQNAISLLALSPSLANLLRAVSGKSTLDLIPNFSDLEHFNPFQNLNRFLKSMLKEDLYDCLYRGFG